MSDDSPAHPTGRSNLEFDHPNMSELRIVLLGTNKLENDRVGNIILKRNAFKTEASIVSVDHQSKRVSRQLKGRSITVINTPDLFHPQLSHHQLSVAVKECVSLCDPGPHVFILVLQPDNFTEENRHRVKVILTSFSDQALNYTMVITTGKTVKNYNKPSNEIIEECRRRSYTSESRGFNLLFEKGSGQHSQLLEKITEIVKENKGHLTCVRSEKTLRGTSLHDEKTTVGRQRLTTLVSELTIVLLGKSGFENKKVGDFILQSNVFEGTATGKQLIKRTGRIEGRPITVINTPDLFHPQLSDHQLSVAVKECVSLSNPRPHVFILVLQPDNFTEEDRKKMSMIINSFSDEGYNHSIVLTVGNLGEGTSMTSGREKNDIEEIISKCGGRHFMLTDSSSPVSLIEMIDQVVEENGGKCISYCDSEDAQQTTGVGMYQVRKRRQKLTKQRFDKTTHKTEPKGVIQRLNLVLCGCAGSVKISISELILGQREPGPESSSVCVRREGEVCGRLLTLVEMPALYNTQLSEEEVMRETLRCVSLCDPGVHAFLLVIPKGFLTDEDKGEMEKIQRIFSSRVSDYTMVLINQKPGQEMTELDESTIIRSCRGGHQFLGSSSQVSELLKSVDKLVDQNRGSHYTTVMYLDALVKPQLKKKQFELDMMMEKIRTLEEMIKNPTPDIRETSDTLRIVMLGKTGVGKSATGNTILGKDVFKEDLSASSVTFHCQRETAEVNGKQITVIDTPGLFDTETDNEDIKKEVAKCITMAAPGPHVFLLVIRLGRFTEEEKNAVKIIKEMFGEKSRTYTVILFTGGDSLKKKSIEQFIMESGDSLRNITKQCGKRYHAFNNNDTDNRTQVEELLKKIDTMVSVNGGSYYTNEMFQEVEEALQEEKERILREREEEIEREKEELKAKHEAEIERMRKTIEEDRKKQDEERKRREMEFNKKEEQIRREMREREERERADYEKRREEDEKKMKEWMSEINREKERRQKEWEEQQEKRKQEEEERRKRDEREKREWEQRQKEEKERFEKEREELKRRDKEERQKRQREYEERVAEEERKQRDLEERIKNAEESKRQELLQQQKLQNEERERLMKEEEKRKEREKEIWELQMQSMEEKWQLEQIRKQKCFEEEREEERKQRDLREREQRQKDEEEKRRVENEANEKIKQMKEEMKMERQREEREKKERDEEYKKEMEEKLRKQREDSEKQKEEEERARKEEEQRNLAYIRKMHDKEKEELRKQTEQAARKQAEKEFCVRLDKKAKEAKAEGRREGLKEGKEKGFKEGKESGHAEGYDKGRKEGAAEVEAKRTGLGRWIDTVFKK